MTIRPATPEDALALSDLITALAPVFVVDPAEGTGFLATLTPEAIRASLGTGRFRYHVAQPEREPLAGAVGIRDGAHLFHLFVAETHQRQGLGARLWETASADALARGNPGRFSVNASRNAVAVYARWGFVASGPEMRKGGLAFTPMALDLAPEARGSASGA